jgi:uncharacterized protein (DUF736 family)
VGSLGTLRRWHGSNESWEGEIAIDAGRFEFRLLPVPGPQSPNGPSHRIVARCGANGEAIIGSAWTKNMIRGPRKGEAFLTLTIRHSSFLKPLNVAAFPTSEPGELSITFRSRQRRAA